MEVDNKTEEGEDDASAMATHRGTINTNAQTIQNKKFHKTLWLWI